MGAVPIPDLNHFVCTLGEAEIYNLTPISQYETINGFFDYQAKHNGDQIAIAIPKRKLKDHLDHENFLGFNRPDYVEDFDGKGPEKLSYGKPSRQGSKGRGHALSENTWPKDLNEKEVVVTDPGHESSEWSVHFYTFGDLLDHSLKLALNLDCVFRGSKDWSSQQLRQTLNLPDTVTHSKCIAYLHHTSGTSGLPKPVPYSHCAACGALPILNGRDTTTFTTTPLFTGGIADFFRTWTSSATICLAPDDGHPLTAEIIVEFFSQTQERYRLFRSGLPNPNPKSMYFSYVPIIAQMLSQTSKGVAFLRTMDIVGVGGATLPKDDGETLISKGINLVSRFGSAECSFVLSTHRRYSVDKEWEYFKVAQAVPYLKFEPLSDDSGRYELVIMKGWPQMAKTSRDDGSWATSDLFEPHPSIENAWKIVSRRDAQITLITGKKFDPIGIEEAMKRHPFIEDVFVFGNGKVYHGAIIIKSEEADSLDDEYVSDTIWPYIESLNKNGPTQAQIFKDMLTKYIIDFQNGYIPDDEENETQRMLSTVQEYSNTLRDETTEASSFYNFVEELDETIIIAGVTGTLGVNIISLLRSLHASRKVVRIVCLVRATNDEEARRRVEKALRYHDIHQGIVSTTTIIEYRAVKLEQMELGLSRDVLDDLRKYGTTIIHAAWEVNF
ncbi:hypothetical protein DID88_003147 [Monilinia fructigena]|uniref:AMP-dependent synthetase/ligase domain-containing protein n=1 Tax=Monilinia fructigena TaxID=38457 RepID=A0A395J022_9HELO|nr:hypothetical protein DID88_003147 [Monilinia fructigena]